MGIWGAILDELLDIHLDRKRFPKQPIQIANPISKASKGSLLEITIANLAKE